MEISALATMDLRRLAFHVTVFIALGCAISSFWLECWYNHGLSAYSAKCLLFHAAFPPLENR